MADRVAIGKTLRIREKGLDEFWLQDQIAANPGRLGLGDLEVISRERQHSSGGRLYLLLKDPEDDSMYEVEVMLGETDESHIIRTLEYWDNEKRRWPQRQHFAVLVAESNHETLLQRHSAPQPRCANRRNSSRSGRSSGWASGPALCEGPRHVRRARGCRSG